MTHIPPEWYVSMDGLKQVYTVQSKPMSHHKVTDLYNIKQPQCFKLNTSERQWANLYFIKT